MKLLLVLFSYLINASGNLELQLLKGNVGEHPRNICSRNGCVDVRADAEGLPKLTSMLQANTVPSAFVGGWHDSDVDHVVNVNGSVTPHDLLTNNTSHAFCARDVGRSLPPAPASFSFGQAGLEGTVRNARLGRALSNIANVLEGAPEYSRKRRVYERLAFDKPATISVRGLESFGAAPPLSTYYTILPTLKTYYNDDESSFQYNLPVQLTAPARLNATPALTENVGLTAPSQLNALLLNARNQLNPAASYNPYTYNI